MAVITLVGNTTYFEFALEKSNGDDFNAAGATLRQYKLFPPNGQVVTGTANMKSGTTDTVHWTRSIDRRGQWRVFVYVESPNFTGHFGPFQFVAEDVA